MKKLLIHNSSKGFTLIELMVVIAILAILAVVGFGTYQGVQGSARDSRRLAEINVLAKNVESTRGVVDQKYTYDSTRFTADYPTPLTDPKTSTGYCLRMVGTSDANTRPANWTATSTNACPSGWTQLVSDFTTPTANLYFMVCAAAERGSDPLCQGPFTK